MAKSWATFCCPGTYKNNYQSCCGIKEIKCFGLDVWVGKPEKRLIKLQMPTDKYIFNLYKTLFNV